VIAGFRYLGAPIGVDFSLARTLAAPRGNGATFGGNGSVFGSPTFGMASAAFAATISALAAIPRYSPLLFRRWCGWLEVDLEDRLGPRLPYKLV